MVLTESLWTQSCFASHLSTLSYRHQQARVRSSLRTEEFLPGSSLLLNAQRKSSLHEGGFDRYLTPPFQYSRIIKWSSPTHTNLSLPRHLSLKCSWSRRRWVLHKQIKTSKKSWKGNYWTHASLKIDICLPIWNLLDFFDLGPRAFYVISSRRSE